VFIQAVERRVERRVELQVEMLERVRARPGTVLPRRRCIVKRTSAVLTPACYPVKQGSRPTPRKTFAPFELVAPGVLVSRGESILS
jgi:hypothetical protein